ncbi:hypothetical protein HUG15_22385 [Salicibibacter cibarius]|uniref:Uncharacterized protein n=1 Tax=Salicibibacter cibarius TaxID=2743000 RepID=A0A7T7CDJ4_9BACI|nr:hypothetical protein HUG15_22385 [Salicibibacter cibarius]
MAKALVSLMQVRKLIFTFLPAKKGYFHLQWKGKISIAQPYLTYWNTLKDKRSDSICQGVFR